MVFAAGQNNPYFPLRVNPGSSNLLRQTGEGFLHLGASVLFFGLGGILKICDSLDGKKSGILYITDDAVRFHIDIGKELFTSGLEKTSPLLIVASVIYLLTQDILNP